MYILLLICRVKWRRERRRTVEADVEWLEGRDLSVSPDNTVGARARAVARSDGCVVSGGRVLSSTQCSRKLTNKFF